MAAKTLHTFDVVRIITQQKTITTGSKHALSIDLLFPFGPNSRRVIATSIRAGIRTAWLLVAPSAAATSRFRLLQKFLSLWPSNAYLPTCF